MKSESQTAPDPQNSASLQTMPQPVHRALRAEDVEQILALQNRTFGSKRTQEDWNWKSVDNPYLQNTGVVGVLGDRIVSAYTIVGLKLNLFGSPVLVGHSTDTVIDVELRGKGYFQFLFDYAMRYGESIGSNAAIGFPNEQAIRTNLNQGQINPLVVVKAYSQRLFFPRQSGSPSISRSLLGMIFKTRIQARLLVNSRRLRAAVGAAVKIGMSSNIPETYEDFWNQTRTREIVSVWKDTEYMKWRYQQNPRHKAEYFSAVKNGVLCGLAVLVRKGNIAYITEIMVRDLDVNVGKLLVNEILQHSLKFRVEVVKFYGHDRGFFELVLSDFMRQPAEDIVFIGEIYNDLLRDLCKQPLNLCLTTGDTDASW